MKFSNKTKSQYFCFELYDPEMKDLLVKELVDDFIKFCLIYHDIKVTKNAYISSSCKNNLLSNSRHHVIASPLSKTASERNFKSGKKGSPEKKT